MAKELYLYNPIYDFVAKDLISAMNENMGEEITLRVNTPGGSVFSNYGICAKMIEHGNINIKVDGTAMSSGANLLLYAKSVECLDTSVFLFHRADMYVSSEEDKEFLARINKDLKAKMLLKIDADLFKEVAGFSIDEMFNSEKRIDVILDAKQAKKLGLVNKINKLTPSEVTAFNNKMFAVAAISNPVTEPKQTIKMDILKLKAEHPSVFAEAVALGVAEEKDRVGACLAFIEIDPKGVVEAIKSGKPLSATQMAEFSVKAMSGKMKAAAIADSADTVTTDDEKKAKTEAEAKVSAFEVEARRNLGLK